MRIMRIIASSMYSIFKVRAQRSFKLHPDDRQENALKCSHTLSRRVDPQSIFTKSFSTLPWVVPISTV